MTLSPQCLPAYLGFVLVAGCATRGSAPESYPPCQAGGKNSSDVQGPDRIEGIVRNRDGDGVRDALVRLSCGEPTNLERSVRTNERGLYAFADVPSQSCRLLASYGDRRAVKIFDFFPGGRWRVSFNFGDGDRPQSEVIIGRVQVICPDH